MMCCLKDQIWVKRLTGCCHEEMYVLVYSLCFDTSSFIYCTKFPSGQKNWGKNLLGINSVFPGISVVEGTFFEVMEDFLSLFVNF